MAHLIVVVLGALVAYLLLVWVSPLHRCSRCHGRKVVAARRGMRPCPRCKGTGRSRRLGARQVHRAIRSRRDGIR